MKNKILLLLIFILAASLRFFYLGKIPNGFYSDEAAYGYNAYSVLKTGKDEYGYLLPLAFKSFGDYKAPLYIYLLTPFVWLGGLSEVSIRFLSALLGLLLVIIIYSLSLLLFKSGKIALLSAYFTAVSPFALQFNRMAHENNLVVVLITAAILFFLLSFQNTKYIYLSVIAFVASIYTYHDARILTPLILLFILIIYYKHFIHNFKSSIFAAILFVVLLFPLLSLLKSPAISSRPSFTVIFSDLGTSLETNQDRGEDYRVNYFAPSLFHNKLLSYSKAFLSNYLNHFAPDFLFFRGDPVKIYQTPSNGLIYPVSLPFLILGVYFIFKYNSKYKWLIMFWLLLAPVASSLTKFSPSASRTLSILPVLSILTAAGLVFAVNRVHSLKFNCLLVIITSVFFLLNIGYYLHYYYIHMPLRFAREWHYGMKSLLGEVSGIQNQYKTVWFSKNAWGYIYPLFYLKYPPEIYQGQDHLGKLNEFGFGWVEGFDKYRFDDFPKNFQKMPNVLFIGAPADFPGLKKALYEIDYPDRQPAFYFTDSNSF